MTETAGILSVNAFWDEEAGVWVATSDDVPGLVTEAESLDALFNSLQVLIPELLELNGSAMGGREPAAFQLVAANAQARMAAA